ncbi:transmembrane protein 109 isoform X1 [Myripristis murdjan]|uniref:Si:dkey-74k8.3 n=1 Tax=Myripristis murdjan TaxID=586833 RepID=A0A667X1T7_9TELE|nr:transmembrane protein 109-like isoform X1 [Myripristis murdjan]
MSFYASGSKRGERGTLLFLFSTVVLVLGFAARCSGEATPSMESPKPASQAVTLRTLITGTCEEIHRYVESVVGTSVIQSAVERAVLFLESLLGRENVYTMAMCVQMVIRFLAEGAASGLNVIAVYVTEILRVTGVDVTLPFPRFTPEGVTAVAQWGLLALIGYWVLSILLVLLIGVVRRVFWMVKTVLSLWLFGLIVSDSGATVDTTAVRLGGLVLGCVLLSLVTCSSEKTLAVETRLIGLEGRLKAMERKKGEE